MAILAGRKENLDRCRRLAVSGPLFISWVKDVGMAKKRTKADRLQRQTEQQEKRVDRRPDSEGRTRLTLRYIGRS